MPTVCASLDSNVNQGGAIKIWCCSEGIEVLKALVPLTIDYFESLSTPFSRILSDIPLALNDARSRQSAKPPYSVAVES